MSITVALCLCSTIACWEQITFFFFRSVASSTPDLDDEIWDFWWTLDEILGLWVERPEGGLWKIEWHPFSQKCSYPAPWNLNYINVMWWSDFADRKLSYYRLTWIFLGRSNLIIWKQRIFSSWNQIWSMRGIQPTITGRVHVKSMRRNMGSPSLQPARNWGPQSYNPKELNLVNSLNEIGSRFLPVSNKEHRQPCGHLDFWPCRDPK